MEAEDKLRKLFSRGHVHDDVWEPAVAILREAASQAREQALLEAVEVTKGYEYIDDGYDANSAVFPTLARDAIEALTTPQAQAEARKRVVAEWLEERAHSDTDPLRAAWAMGLLAALKESE